jgi:H+/Cl- antiporter ClcA
MLKSMLISSVVAIPVGTASALFLYSLDQVTHLRDNHTWIIALLPLAGLLIGFVYHYLGKDIASGNNLILHECQNPVSRIPFKMAPMVFASTLMTHLFGGSAGREGTAVQMGGAIADQFSHFVPLNSIDRKIILIIGISAGFSSVFGTPFAGAMFAIEVLVLGKIYYKAILPSVFAALIANYICSAWQISHTVYTIPQVPAMNVLNFFWSALAGLICGVTAKLFTQTLTLSKNAFSSAIQFPPLRPFAGGIFIAIAVYMMGTTKYIGLGIPTILQAFEQKLFWYDFLIKIAFTAITLGSGFKGGEVTPLFFIGATLGNALVWFIPLPVSLLAGMGFVAVFAGASNTPIACILLGIELFGVESAFYIGIACLTAYISSGNVGIYAAQNTGRSKFQRWIQDSQNDQ